MTEQLHDFSKQIERRMMMVVLVSFGSAFAEGSLMSHVDWRVIIVAAPTIAIVRSAAGWISLIGGRRLRAEKFIVSIFGIRGLGSLYYLAYASGKVPFAGIKVIWARDFLIILLSVIVHGVAAPPVMRWINCERGVDSMCPMPTNRQHSHD